MIYCCAYGRLTMAVMIESEWGVYKQIEATVSNSLLHEEYKMDRVC